jgi:pimeloyl-ACP methyl ester carboxylesterase
MRRYLCPSYSCQALAITAMLGAGGCLEPTDDPALGAVEGEVIPSDPYFIPVRPGVQGGAVNGYVLIGDYTAAQLDAGAASAGFSRMSPPAAAARCNAKLWELSFQTTGPGGGALKNATTAVITPHGTNSVCNSADPTIFVLAQGTQLDSNARAADPNNFVTRQVAAYYAAQGFTVVIPDYLGNGNPYNFPAYPKLNFHPYLHAQSEATTILDAIRATRKALGKTGVAKVHLLGGSQGAHVAAAASMLIGQQYPTEFRLTAAAFNVAPFDLPALVRYAEATPAVRVLYDKVMAAWALRYNDGRALTAAQRDAIARTNDIGASPYVRPSISIQLCGTALDKVVPFQSMSALQQKIGANAVLTDLTRAQLDAVKAAVPELAGADEHALAGTSCIAREYAYFAARR